MIHKVDPAGYISIAAGVYYGVGAYAGDGGPATKAYFDRPWGIAIDKHDNILIYDGYNHRVRRIDAKTGIITCVAGNGDKAHTDKGTHSGDGGPATAAGLGIGHLAVDCSGNIYLAEGYFSRVRKITYVEAPAFTGELKHITMCENSAAVSVDALLGATDAGVGQPVDWNVHIPAKHGVVSGTYTIPATGLVQSPVGFTYTPAAGYSGADSFTIVVGECLQNGDARTIYVTVNPLPVIAAITGLSAICKGSIVTLSTGTTGGVWSVAGTAIAVSGGTVTGITPGTATISYTVTDGNGCTNAATYGMKVGDCPAGIRPLAPGGKLRVYPNPARDVLHIDRVEGECTYRLMNIIGNTVQAGTLYEGENAIKMKDVANGIYMLEIAGNASGAKTINRIVKQ